MSGLEEMQVFSVPQSSYANGTHAAVVEVDLETGAVTVLRWVVAHVCGRVLQPAIVEGQIHGGVVQGIPDALNDQLAHDEAGQPLAATLINYALATAADAPPVFEIGHLEPRPRSTPSGRRAQASRARRSEPCRRSPAARMILYSGCVVRASVAGEESRPRRANFPGAPQSW